MILRRLIPQQDSKLEEGRGFEPLRPCGLTVFKTVAIDHSAIPPGQSPIVLAPQISASRSPRTPPPANLIRQLVNDRLELLLKGSVPHRQPLRPQKSLPGCRRSPVLSQP